MSHPMLYAFRNPQSAIFLLLYASPGRTATRTTYHHYVLKDSDKLQVAHNPHSLSIKLRFRYAYHMRTVIKVHILARVPEKDQLFFCPSLETTLPLCRFSPVFFELL